VGILRFEASDNRALQPIQLMKSLPVERTHKFVTQN
jgi:hypothetical protein